MKNIKYKIILILSTTLFFLFFTDNSFGNTKSVFKNFQTQTQVLENISQISDTELYQIAKRVNEDALPGESEYAQILLTEAIRKNPENVDVLIEFAHLTDMQSMEPMSKLRKKFHFLYQAFLIEPNNPKVRYKFADLLIGFNQKDLFQQIYAQTLNEFPHHIETSIEKIQVFSNSDPKSAIDLSKQILKNGRDISDFLPYFLIALQKCDKEENYSKNLLPYAEEYPNRWLWYELGMQYAKEKKYSKAEYAFQKSIALGNTLSGRLQLGIVQYRNQNKLQESILNLKSVVHELKNHLFISKNVIYYAHTHLARALIISQKLTEAKNELNFLAKYASQNHNYFITIINDFVKNGQSDLLEGPMKIAIENDPMFAFPYSVLANILKKQKKDKLAHDVYEKFLVLSEQK